MHPDLDTFLADLRAAFPSTPIHPLGAFRPWGTTYPDADEYTKQLDSKAWDEVDRTYALRRSDALGFLGTDHLVAVLPLYLRDIVENGAWSQAAGMLTLILAKPVHERDGLGTMRFEALVNALTPAQRVVVASALRALSQQDAGGSLGNAAAEALARFWSTYLKGPA